MRMQIRPSSPFDFSLTIAIFSDGDKRIRRYEEGKHWQVVGANGKLVLIIVTSHGTVDKPELCVEPKSNEMISSQDGKAIVETVCSLFNLGLDLDQFYEDVKADEIMSALVQRLRGLNSSSTSTVFEALVDSIVEQQISLHVAHSIQRKLVKAFGDVLTIDDEAYYAFPTPQSLASASVEQLRVCGLGLRKTGYIRNVSRLAESGDLDLEALKDRQDTDEIIRELDRIPGIGIWTAELTVVRGMRRFGVIPADDLGVRRCISHYYCNNRKISGLEARKIAEKWGRWKGLASFYLIVAKRLGIEVRSSLHDPVPRNDSF
jgi:DNA-3-methyladenine glycosylase II